MFRTAILLLGALWVSPAPAQSQIMDLQQVVARFLDRAPMQLTYRYSLIHADFRQDTTGVLYLARQGVFRVTVWDKVYASDGRSLYLHDRNTHQTVIDSLRWTEVHLWVRLLQGELPPAVEVVGIVSEESVAVWTLRNENPFWQAAVGVDTADSILYQITLHEAGNWTHEVRLEPPTPWEIADPDSWIALKDLPGPRLDLR